MKTAFRASPFVIGIAFAAILCLPACSGKPAEPAPLDTGVSENESSEATAEAPPPAVEAPSSADRRGGAETKVEAPLPDDADQSPQIADDADAAGMTARLPDNSDSSAPAEK